MFDIITRLFDPSGFPERWECGDWSKTLGWLHICSDLATFAAYYAVPLVVTFFVIKRKDIPYRGILLAFIAMVFFSCGTVHLVEAGIFWWPHYRLSGVLKLFTAIVSCGMVGVLIVATPKALGLRNLAAMAGDLQRENAERKRAEEELREAHGRLQAILDATANAIITVNHAGEIQSFNAAAERMFGYDAESACGNKLSRMLPDLIDFARFESETTGESRKLEREVAGIHKDGKRIHLAARVTEACFGESRQLLVTLEDISDRKQAERERQQLSKEIGEAAVRLSAASTEITAVTSQQVDAANAQAATVSQATTSVHEIARSAENSAQLAREVSESASQADVVSKSGREAVDNAIAAMQTVRERVELTAASILDLAERAHAIGAITTTVNEIADQTNVLALNAAIEASRAGEHGKGFAVVAAEVKSLADQSKAATHKISEILGEIRRATDSAVLSTEQGTNSVGEASKVVADTKQTINSLAETIGEAARAGSRIVKSATQQAAAMRQVSDAVSEIERQTTQNLTASEQVEKSAKDLYQLGIRLGDLISTNLDSRTA